MKNIFKILFLSFLFVACQQKIKPEDIAKINGYWEIEKVVFDQGKDKEYGINESYDYFQIDKNNKGFRKKVMPQLDGTFIVNDSQEDVKIRFQEDKVFFDYVTPYAKWSEELITISDKKLVFKNAEKKEYHYKKAEPLNILGDGEKTK
ncbi:lipocalin family protein [Flavobacterium limnophilum]|uniref:lipocalin family protein n=1 Tax=Flavobacterium limnophilum TaxID=3003262 RepID=UPI0022AC1A36|nr:lipocalin family protein [Flavobacterium limnophilum]